MITDIPIEVLDIEGDGFHILLMAEINGKPARLIIDTGASRSVFDQERLKLFFEEEIVLEAIDTTTTGIGATKIGIEITSLKSLKLGKLLIGDYKAAVINISHVNQTYESIGLEPIDGMVGNDILMEYGAVIDFNAGVLELSF